MGKACSTHGGKKRDKSKVLMESQNERDLHDGLEDNIKIDLRKRVWGCRG
jgi:hypothetical protein